MPHEQIGYGVWRGGRICQHGRLLVALLLLMCGVCGGARVGSALPQSAPTLSLRRVAILPPPPPETDRARVQRLLEAVRALEETPRGMARPKSSLLEGEDIPPNVARFVAEAFFAEALADRLREQSIAVVPATEVQDALRALSLSRGVIAQTDGARRLCAHLDCDALLLPVIYQTAKHEGVMRDLSVWGGLLVPYVRVIAESPLSAVAPDAPRLPFAPPVTFPVAGSASCGRKLFRAVYARPTLLLLRDAAAQAARLAARALRTGETAPFLRVGERVAIAPVPAPVQVDKLLFSSEGRRVVSDAARELPGEVSDQFAPDLLPLSSQEVLRPETIRQELTAAKKSLPVLWKAGEQPDIPRAQELGRFLRVDYVLLARVTDIQMEEGPPNPVLFPEMALEREARVEAIGALVRVKDAALLWHDQAVATMTVRTPKQGGAKLATTDSQLAQDATRFALLQLQRLLRQYRSRFEH